MSSLYSSSRAIAIWLLMCCALVFAMVVLGGVTRLTRSGLSIVEWQPVMGALPPLTQERWQEEFEKYRQTPEFRKVNSDMTLSGFKSIYWVEYAHRLLGRVIGFAFLVPFLFFLARRRIDRSLAGRFALLFVLGGLQGALGWYMVASGLVDNPRVSAYRLTAHLGLAVIIYGYMFTLALDLWFARHEAAAVNLQRYARALVALIFVTILAGGFVAGTHAGFAFNTFPLMNGKFVPEGAYATAPLWRDWFENVATVQFHHRLLAYATLVGVTGFWAISRRHVLSPRSRNAIDLWLGAVLLQIALGIATVLTIVPIPLGAAHQAGALLLFTAGLLTLHALKAR